MKKIMFIILIFIIIFFINIMIFLLINKKNNNKINNFYYESEITNVDSRNTVYAVYFYNEKKDTLEKENQIIDVKKLMKNPYNTLLEKLMEEPQNNNLKKIIPNKTKINNVFLQNNILVIDFSKEFIEDQKLGYNNEKNIIYSIVNTMGQLNEVDGIKILIDGQEKMGFKDEKIKFDVIFKKEIKN